MKYYTQNNIHIIECDPDELSIIMVDKTKKNLAYDTYVNAGFFGYYADSGTKFTMPVGNIVCDVEGCEFPKKYFPYWGKTVGNKFYFDSYSFEAKPQFYQKAVTTFIIEKGKPRIKDVTSVQPTWQYAVAGVPVMKNGQDVKWLTYVNKQGWLGSELYGTKHIFIGLKQNSDKIYIMGWKSTTSNLVYSGEAYKKFKALGFYDVMKLDGGGSYHYKVNGTAVDSMSENRRINNIICVKDNKKGSSTTTKKSDECPYPTPTIVVSYGCKNATAVKWLQWQLCKHGFDCEIDGSFGSGTKATLKLYQKSAGLSVDGSCGPATRAELLK